MDLITEQLHKFWTQNTLKYRQKRYSIVESKYIKGGSKFPSAIFCFTKLKP